MVIEVIHNPSEKLQELAVSQNGNAIQFIKNPSERIKKLAASQIRYKSGNN